MPAQRFPSQDHGVARLQGKGSGIDGDVGARLVDDTDNPERDALLRDPQADLGPPTSNDLTDWVRKGNDLADGLGNRPETIRIQRETVKQAVAHLLGAATRQILGISRQNLVGAFNQRRRNSLQTPILQLGRSIGENASRRACGIGHLGNISRSIHPAIMTYERAQSRSVWCDDSKCVAQHGQIVPVNSGPGMLMARQPQLVDARSGDLGKRIGVVAADAACDQSRRRGDVDDITSIKVAEHLSYARDQERLLALR